MEIILYVMKIIGIVGIPTIIALFGFLVFLFIRKEITWKEVSKIKFFVIMLCLLSCIYSLYYTSSFNLKKVKNDLRKDLITLLDAKINTEMELLEKYDSNSDAYFHFVNYCDEQYVSAIEDVAKRITAIDNFLGD